jgi:electron transfer flavoprotein alpha subunit
LNAVWVIAEHNAGSVREASLEVIGEGRALADQLRVPLHGIVLGDALDHLVESLTRQDVDAVYLLSHPLLQFYSTDGFTAALAQLLDGVLSGPVLISATALGSDLAPRLAARLNIPLAADCIWVKTGPSGDLRLVQPVHQERAQRTLSYPAGVPIVASLRPGVIGIDPPARWRTPQVIGFHPDLTEEHIRTQVVSIMPGDPRLLDLAEADVIVAGGRGVRDTDGWELLEALAGELGASMGGSRMAMDLGYISRRQMIGQTGAWIRPRLYLAAGISGASHHIGGIKAGDFIAINTDAHAPIFKHSTLNVAGDLYEILPRLTHKIRALKGGGE